MSLHRRLRARAAAADPIRVGVIGCGKFATMFLAQVPTTPGLEVVAVVDRDPARARANLVRAGWPPEAAADADLDAAIARGGVHVGEDVTAMLADGRVDVVVEATGDACAGVDHAAAAIDAGKHVVMVNVEADVLAGPALAERAAAAGVVYGFAYGDQPALICELVDWATTCGFTVVAAGKGTRYLPYFHRSTPATVWEHMGFDPAAAEAAGMNPKMFNSFVDGTKSAIEMAAVANATGLVPQRRGLGFPACGAGDLARRLRGPAAGGVLEHEGTVEVVADLERDGRAIDDHLRWGVYVVVRAPNAYAARCLKEYGVVATDDGYAALYRPFHLIGLELARSIAAAVEYGEAIGATAGFVGDVAAVAKRPLAAGETLDGEGGTTVYGHLLPAADAVAKGALPIGLAHGVRLTGPVPAGAVVCRDTVAAPPHAAAAKTRTEIEEKFIESTRPKD
ncbi:MAG: Gfo/Idh/MocA family oxidoreductase [Deinococcus-Thermus bacterium]|jgi:predicted homoserine dehydrogenase-like protein|nr:Gfo/Idh/MocA family oxidoreductase [Deinococcota bacterium]